MTSGVLSLLSSTNIISCSIEESASSSCSTNGLTLSASLKLGTTIDNLLILFSIYDSKDSRFFLSSLSLSLYSAADSNSSSAAAFLICFSTVRISFSISLLLIDSGSFSNLNSSSAICLEMLIVSLTAFLIVLGVILLASL